ncbi:MAG: bifunctional 5,10-methylenetetrahydrofolate dehydrogenase/5,10-methenyltetrahydrofolate cyclohydrolase [Puniceicoccales bacterium]|jgi:methylenetetrahydrofolate dehydrogenase (NADP+)/methenyltetrahydrofolate cyclohydrolase|nr:bifunctional 5,10-methylenetetrahydrofolate dehydrogenase/5,10-methenyltetrahydrofolate cyclohydrolase [Puniceicoccales bacterium]
MAIILDGTAAAKRILLRIGEEISSLQIRPKLAIVFVGDNSASEIYVRNKLTRARALGIDAQLVRLTAKSTIGDILGTIERLNADPSVSGIIVQAPLPDNSMQSTVFNAIAAEKDVDGFSDRSIAKLVRGASDGFISCTPLGICELLREFGIGISGKHIVVLGRSCIVGRPLSILLSQKSENFNGTVTLCHSGTKNLASLTAMADIIVIAIGKKFFLKKHMLRPGVVVVDVGINREFDPNAGKYRIFGDADFDGIRDMCYAISPVPGGVGPMTVAMLMHNTLAAAKLQHLQADTAAL